VSTDAGQQSTWLTQEAFDRLSSELAEAKGPRRADIVAKIEAAREEQPRTSRASSRPASAS